MSTITAIVRNGRIEVDQPLNLPEGTVLQIPLPKNAERDDESMRPEEIEQVLAAMDRMEPLQMSDTELAWEADRQARRDSEKMHFYERASKLHGMWK